MATAEKILEIARSQIGTKEFPAKSDNVKYNTAYYGRAVSGGGYPWCAVFVWWVFREAGASDLYYGGDKTAYCPTLMSFHKKQKVTDYRPGDIVFFNFSGKSSAGHVGICESWDGTYITTIDGNTGGASEDNGGAVMRRRRHKKYIVGAYRPDYEEEESVTYEQWLEYLERYRREAAAKKASMPELLEEAVELGLTDGSRPIVSNFPCTGMHGGKLFLRSDCRDILFPGQVVARPAVQDELREIEPYLHTFCRLFGGRCDALLRHPFTVVTPNSSDPYRQLYVTN